jgi:hypothetical protein
MKKTFVVSLYCVLALGIVWMAAREGFLDARVLSSILGVSPRAGFAKSDRTNRSKAALSTNNQNPNGQSQSYEDIRRQTDDRVPMSAIRPTNDYQVVIRPRFDDSGITAGLNQRVSGEAESKNQVAENWSWRSQSPVIYTVLPAILLLFVSRRFAFNCLFRLVLGGSFLLLSYVFSSKSSGNGRTIASGRLKRQQLANDQLTDVRKDIPFDPGCESSEFDCEPCCTPTSKINDSIASQNSRLIRLGSSIATSPKKSRSLVSGRAILATVMVSGLAFAAWQGGFIDRATVPTIGHVTRNDSSSDDRNPGASSKIDAPDGEVQQPEAKTLKSPVSPDNEFQIVIAPRRDNGISKPSPNLRNHGSQRIQGLFGDAGALNKVGKLIEDANELKQFAESALGQGGNPTGKSNLRIPALDF